MSNDKNENTRILIGSFVFSKVEYLHEEDKTILVKSASEAQKAVDYIYNLGIAEKEIKESA